jgi:hypothetical protein
MPQRGSPRRGPIVALTLVALALALALALAQTPIPSQPVSLQVFKDTFDSGSSYATYRALGGATLTQSGGQLKVANPAGSPAAGFSMTLPAGGIGVRCVEFDGFAIPTAPIGTYLDWTWYGFDDATGARVVVLQTHVEKTGSFTVRHRKADGTLVVQKVPDKDWSDVKSHKWDTRRSGKQVMLEIQFKDGSKYNSAWLDPQASTISGFDVTGNLESYSLDTVAGEEFHTDTEPAVEPVQVPVFAGGELAGLSHYFIGQTDDSDAVAVGRVVARASRLSAPLGGDPRPRLRVEYAPAGTLRGSLPRGRLVVYHAIDDLRAARRFQPGSRWVLYLQRGSRADGLPADWFWDYGHPTGVVPYSRQNLAAATARISIFYGGPNR